MRLVVPILMGLCGLVSANLQAAPPSSATSQTPAEGPKDRRPRAIPLTAQQVIEHAGLLSGNNTPEARRLGAARLLESATPEAIQKLIDVLKDRPGDAAAQIAVCEAVAAADGPSPDLIQPLMGLLGDKRPRISDVVIQAFCRFERQAVIASIGALVADEGVDVDKRLAGLTALAALADDMQAVAAIVRQLHSASPSVRASALAACRQAIGSDLPDADAVEDWWKSHAQMSALDWLARRNDQKASDLRRSATEIAIVTSRLVSAYRDAYRRIPESERPARLQALLGDSFPAVRQLGLDLVNDLITDRRDITPEIKAGLFDLLTDSNAAVRLQATRIAGDLRLAGAFSKLSRAILQESDPAVRIAQINAIGRLDDPNVVEILLDRLNDDVSAVVGEAALALGRASRRPDWARMTAADSAKRAPQALADRYGSLRPNQDELREKLLTAMSMMGDSRFRPILRSEIESKRCVAVRRAAIAGLAAFADTDAADALRPCLGDMDADIRLAAADGLAKCGRRRGDLGVLVEHLDSPREMDPSVRQRAWESYLLISAQLPLEEQIKVSDEFDRPTDKVSQRRRLEILKSLANDNHAAGSAGPKPAAGKLETLSKARKLEVLDRIADAQWNVGDYSAAGTSLDQAISLLEEAKGSRFVTLAARCVAARLKAHEDALAIQHLKEFVGSIPDDSAGKEHIARCVIDEARSRTDSASEAALFADAANLIQMAGPIIRPLSQSLTEQLESIGKDLISKRSSAVDQLLATLASDPDAESKALAYPRDLVLRNVGQKLRAATSGNSAAGDLVDRWMQIAKRLSPGWPGWPPDASQEDRAAAVNKLLSGIAGAKSADSSQRRSAEDDTLRVQSTDEQ
ncbi:MAG TPA: HEAT repeat domain-containing protein [Phycisphaerae bacterium]|nr:HEAT repeat domain-containing protein [Phycisphaerae bacterium]